MVGAIVQLAVAAAKDINRTIAGGVTAKRRREDAVAEAGKQVEDMERQREESAEAFDYELDRSRKSQRRQQADIIESGERMEADLEKKEAGQDKLMRDAFSEEKFGTEASMGLLESEQRKMKKLGGR